MADVIVVKNGSFMCKAGFASESEPSVVLRSVVGTPRNSNMGGINDLVCDRALCARCPIPLRYPISRGIVSNWEDMESIWRYTLYDELHADPEKHPVLLTEPPLNPKAAREKMTQIMFETFNTPALYIANQAVLSLYASGRTTGIVLDSGYNVSRAVPIYEGFALHTAILQLDIGGHDITKELVNLLDALGFHFTTREYEIVSEIQKKLSYVTIDYEKDSTGTTSIETSYELPDGNVITTTEGFKWPKKLFQSLDSPGAGVHELVYNSIMKCDDTIRKTLYENVVLAGGSTKIPGFVERMNKELVALAPSNMELKVIRSEAKYSAWAGGSMLASLSSFSEMWMSHVDYDEIGPTLAHRMCF